MSETVLEIKDLSKSYGKVKALQKLSLSVEKGSVYGLLGPNGSGKTTTLGILLGIHQMDSGSFSWFENQQNDANRMRIGAILETPNFYPYLSARQNLRVVGHIKKIDNLNTRIDNVLERVGLKGREKDNFKTYSLGMKQRLALGSALLSDPEVLVLDEPTNGLDPQGIAQIRTLISDIAKEGKTILIASHILDEIEKICTHVAILRKGELLSEGPLSTILSHDSHYKIASDNMVKLAEIIKELSWVSVLSNDDKMLTVKIDESKGSADLNRALFEKQIVLSDLTEIKKNLETTFLETIDK